MRVGRGRTAGSSSSSIHPRVMDLTARFVQIIRARGALSSQFLNFPVLGAWVGVC